MNTTKQTNLPAQWPRSQTLEALYEPFFTGEQVAVALNLPLYYFKDGRKRAELGVPYYCINRMVRYRIREVHKWMVDYTAKQAVLVQVLETKQVGGRHA